MKVLVAIIAVAATAIAGMMAWDRYAAWSWANSPEVSLAKMICDADRESTLSVAGQMTGAEADAEKSCRRYRELLAKGRP